MNNEKQTRIKRLNNLVIEHQLLIDRMAKLAFALENNELDESHKIILDHQLESMEIYEEILYERILNGVY